jgi:hypothetical protein
MKRSPRVLPCLVLLVVALAVPARAGADDLRG